MYKNKEASYIVDRFNQCLSNTGNLYANLVGYKTRLPIITYRILHYNCRAVGREIPERAKVGVGPVREAGYPELL
jgi:hypothetical protein